MTFRSQLELVTADTVVWKPSAFFHYGGDYDLEIHMSLRRWSFYSFTSWELYMGDHCWRQMTGEIRIPRCQFAATFGQASSQAVGPMEVARYMVEGDYAAWFRSVSIGRFTTTTQVRGGRSIGAEQERFYQMMRDVACRDPSQTSRIFIYSGHELLH